MVISKAMHQVFHYAGIMNTRSLMVIFSFEPCFPCTCIIIERLTGSYILYWYYTTQIIVWKEIYMYQYMYAVLISKSCVKDSRYGNIQMHTLCCMWFIQPLFFKLIVTTSCLHVLKVIVTTCTCIWNCLFNHMYVYSCKSSIQCYLY